MKSDLDLSEHKRVRSQLIAPWNRLLNNAKFKLSAWRLERMPEFVWINELIAYHGNDQSLNILTEIVKAAHATHVPGDSPLSCLASTWSRVRHERIQFVRRTLRVSDQLEPLRAALRILHTLYPAYPTQLLVAEGDRQPLDNSEIEGFKLRLQTLFDRFKAPAIRVQAHAIIAQLKAGIMVIPGNMQIPDLNLLYSESKADVEKDEYQRAAGFVRSSASACFAMLSQIPTVDRVPEYFWAQGLRIQPCKLEVRHG
ncbi:MAG: hypothetical protein ACTHLN_11580 [Tepidisphaeraceae bacterium]